MTCWSMTLQFVLHTLTTAGACCFFFLVSTDGWPVWDEICEPEWDFIFWPRLVHLISLCLMLFSKHGCNTWNATSAKIIIMYNVWTPAPMNPKIFCTIVLCSMVPSAARLPPPIKYVFSKAELLPRTDYLLGTSILNIAHVSSLIPPPTQCPIESVW